MRRHCYVALAAAEALLHAIDVPTSEREHDDALIDPKTLRARLDDEATRALRRIEAAELSFFAKEHPGSSGGGDSGLHRWRLQPS